MNLRKKRKEKKKFKYSGWVFPHAVPSAPHTLIIPSVKPSPPTLSVPSNGLSDKFYPGELASPRLIDSVERI